MINDQVSVDELIDPFYAVESIIEIFLVVYSKTEWGKMLSNMLKAYFIIIYILQIKKVGGMCRKSGRGGNLN